MQERNSKWLNDDYVKFIRYGQHLIERTGEGVLAFITNHGYLDNPTFRGMRWHLLRPSTRFICSTCTEKQEEGNRARRQADENVFDIQQGVSIIIADKSGRRKEGRSLSLPW